MASRTKRDKSRKKPSSPGRKAGDQRLGGREDLMRSMAKELGNQELQQRLRRATARRDAMLAFIAERLRQMRDLQLKESALLQRKDRWWRDAAWREPGVWSPAPERWQAVAKGYRQAIEALCRGQLTRGARLLERAMDAERSAIDAVPHGLGLRPDESQQRDAARMAGEAGEIGQGEGCPDCPRPPELQLAHSIEAFSHTARPLRGIKVVPHATPWWEEEEDEEEEEEGEGG
jgi:hypothetical protein